MFLFSGNILTQYDLNDMVTPTKDTHELNGASDEQGITQYT